MLTLQLGTGQVDGGRVGGRPRADDNDLAVHPPLADGVNLGLVEWGVFLGERCDGSYGETASARAEGAS
jgi:hypothetical protein